MPCQLWRAPPRVEACAPLKDGISVGGPPSADNVVGEAPSGETTVVPLLSTRHLTS